MKERRALMERGHLKGREGINEGRALKEGERH